MNDQKQLMNIFAQAYQLIAKASKQQPSQEGFQQILEMLGEEGIKECAKVANQGPEAVAQAMVQIIQQKQTQKAANGAKLKYIMQLQGKCQPGYLKKGGRCKPCEMAEGVFRNKADMFYEGGDFKNNKSKYWYSRTPNSEVVTDLQNKNWYSRTKTKDGYQYHAGNGFDKNMSVPTIEGDEFESLLNNTRGRTPQNPTLLPSMQHIPSSDKTTFEYNRRQLQNDNERLLNDARNTIENKINDNRQLLDQNLKTRQNLLPSRTEGVRDKDGKLRGTKNYSYRSSGITVTPKKKQDGGNIPEDKQWFTSKGYSQYHPDNEQEIVNNFNFQQSLQRLKPKGITPKGNAYFKLSM